MTMPKQRDTWCWRKQRRLMRNGQVEGGFMSREEWTAAFLTRLKGEREVFVKALLAGWEIDRAHEERIMAIMREYSQKASAPGGESIVVPLRYKGVEIPWDEPYTDEGDQP